MQLRSVGYARLSEACGAGEPVPPELAGPQENPCAYVQSGFADLASGLTFVVWQTE